MSTIAGIVHFESQPVETPQLITMASRLAQRGSDAASVWHQNRVGFVSGEGSPPFAITADARIDNRNELLRALRVAPTDATDTALILAAYECWGERCVEHLVGDFSFAIWDERQHKLFCARDHMGIRPFYYFWSGSRFVFASEIRAILALPEIPRRVNELKLVDLLVAEYHDHAATFYQGIQRLPPAHTLIVSEQGLRSARYWSLDAERELRLDSESAYIEQFREIFLEAVQCRLSIDAPIGSMLSGGLDSSAVTSTARLLLAPSANALHSFSAVFPSLPQVDESAYINAVLDQGSVTPHYLNSDEVDLFEQLDQMLWSLEEPHPFPNLYIVWHACMHAAQMGIKVMLDGTDGDSAVSHGMGLLREIAYRGDWDGFAASCFALTAKYSTYNYAQKSLVNQYGLATVTDLARQGRMIAAIRGVNALGTHFKLSRRDVLRKAIWRPLIHHDPVQPLLPPSIDALLAPDFKQRVDLAGRRDALQAARIHPVRTDRHEQVNTLTTAWVTEVLDVLHKTGTAFGIEMRHPFYDKRLLEFCVSVPASQKLSDGWTRLILRKAMEGVLPSEIQWREGKSNLGPGFTQALMRSDQGRIKDVVFEPNSPLSTYLNMQRLQRVYQRFAEKQHEKDGLTLWSVTLLRHWLERFDRM